MTQERRPDSNKISPELGFFFATGMRLPCPIQQQLHEQGRLFRLLMRDPTLMLDEANAAAVEGLMEQPVRCAVILLWLKEGKERKRPHS